MTATRYILSVNCGSSSLKYKLFTLDESLQLLSDGQVSGIGASGDEEAQLTVQSYVKDGQKGQTAEKGLGKDALHETCLQKLVDYLTDSQNEPQALTNVDAIEVITHRVVHGGSATEPLVITKDHTDGLRVMDELSTFAPLHNHHAVLAVRACLKQLPKAKNVLFFDTVFHQDMPASAKMYPLAPSESSSVAIKRYGFHGISYAYILKRVASFLQKRPEETNLICLHLGSGASMTAICQGKCIDTTMGLTPLEGIVGGTRSGSIDPSLIFHYIDDAASMVDLSGKPANEKTEVKITLAEYTLNKKAGLVGMAGTSNMKTIQDNMNGQGGASQDEQSKCKLAFEVFVDRILSPLGGMYLKLGGKVDAICFSGGIGEKSSAVREAIVRPLEFLQILMDTKKNDNLAEDAVVDITKSGPIKLLVVQTDEEFEMADQYARHGKTGTLNAKGITK